ncbi:crinkler family protein [Moniliophthora roreri]|nr:crinkler family protein [Moniliophthora roreri]
MSTVKLNVFVTNSQRLILGEKSDDSLDYGNLLERVRLQLRSQFLQLYLVPNGLIKLPDTIKIPDLKGTLLKDVCRRDAGAFVVPMGLSLRDMILNHSVNDPHFVAKETVLPELAVYRTDTQTVSILEPIDDGQPVDEIVIAVFGNNFGMENPNQAIALDIADDGLAALGDLNLICSRLKPTDRLVDAFPWGVVPSQVHIIAESSPETAPEEHQDSFSDLPFIERRRRFFQNNPSKAPSSEGKVETFIVRQGNPSRQMFCGRPAALERPVPSSLLDETMRVST